MACLQHFNFLFIVTHFHFLPLLSSHSPFWLRCSNANKYPFWTHELTDWSENSQLIVSVCRMPKIAIHNAESNFKYSSGRDLSFRAISKWVGWPKISEERKNMPPPSPPYNNGHYQPRPSTKSLMDTFYTRKKMKMNLINFSPSQNTHNADDNNNQHHLRNVSFFALIMNHLFFLVCQHRLRLPAWAFWWFFYVLSFPIYLLFFIWLAPGPVALCYWSASACQALSTIDDVLKYVLFLCFFSQYAYPHNAQKDA